MQAAPTSNDSTSRAPLAASEGALLLRPIPVLRAIPVLRPVRVLRVRAAGPLPRADRGRSASRPGSRSPVAPAALLLALFACLCALFTLAWALSLQRRASRSPRS